MAAITQFTRPRPTEPIERLSELFSGLGPPRLEAIAAALAALNACFPQRELPEASFYAYLEVLRELSNQQLATAFSRAAREQERFFPTPGELRRLAGVETADQCGEREAREGLDWVLWRIRKHGREGRGTASNPCPSTPDRIKAALEELGAGSVDAGVALVARHPLLSRDPDEYPTLGLELAAIEKLEARWFEVWRRG